MMRALRPQGGRSSPEENGAFPFRLPGPQGNVWYAPRVFTYPGRQQAVITAAGGWQGVYTWYAPGTCGLFQKSTQTVMGGEE